eukprot:757248-Rhodomonas_salina.2
MRNNIHRCKTPGMLPACSADRMQRRRSRAGQQGCYLQPFVLVHLVDLREVVNAMPLRVEEAQRDAVVGAQDLPHQPRHRLLCTVQPRTTAALLRVRHPCSHTPAEVDHDREIDWRCIPRTPV